MSFRLFAVIACGQKNNNTMKTLVLFFSHAGDNYNVGNIEVGNTKIVADYISEKTGADQFEIVAEKNYDLPCMDLINLAQQESLNGDFPSYKGDIDLSEYDVIFIGGPIWWGTYPHVMFSFFKEHDLNGKRLIPFTTHEGSGLGNTIQDVNRYYPQADVDKGFSIAGHDVLSGKETVEKWLTELGY